MGTRAAYGFRINEQDKVTYNHFDGYPAGLGHIIIAQLINFANGQSNGDVVSATTASTEVVKDRYELARENILNLQLVDEDAKPSPEQIEENRQFLNLDVGNKTDQEWYSLLRNAQGTIEHYLDGTLKVMIDSHGFLRDSLFCEWAYILNFDTGCLEIYRGFNTTNTNGRYAQEDTTEEYRPVSLLVEVDFHLLMELTEDKLAKFCGLVEDLGYDDVLSAKVHQIKEIKDLTELKMISA